MRLLPLQLSVFSYLSLRSACRINKKNSQKDSEQKRAGNYFFFDDGDDEEDVDADDL